LSPHFQQVRPTVVLIVDISPGVFLEDPNLNLAEYLGEAWWSVEAVAIFCKVSQYFKVVENWVVL
jgi:hypothetical protein